LSRDAHTLLGSPTYTVHGKQEIRRDRRNRRYFTVEAVEHLLIGNARTSSTTTLISPDPPVPPDLL